MEPKNALGRLCRDVLLNYSGICTRIDDFLFGCRTYILQKPVEKDVVPEDTDKDPVMYIVDEARLEVIDSDIAINPADVQGKLPGGAPLFQTTRIVTL